MSSVEDKKLYTKLRAPKTDSQINYELLEERHKRTTEDIKGIKSIIDKVDAKVEKIEETQGEMRMETSEGFNSISNQIAFYQSEQGKTFQKLLSKQLVRDSELKSYKQNTARDINDLGNKIKDIDQRVLNIEDYYDQQKLVLKLVNNLYSKVLAKKIIWIPLVMTFLTGSVTSTLLFIQKMFF